MRTQLLTLTTAAFLCVMKATSPAADEVRLLTLDPAHFHAALVQKFMYPQVSPTVHVYSPGGADLEMHLQRIDGFNTRAENPTHWKEEVYTGKDYFERMLREKAGNVVVISGNNLKKTEYIARSIAAGFNVLADKPMAITPAAFTTLKTAFATAASKKVLLYDIMTERSEITTILQRELSRMPEVFGSQEPGTPGQPGIEIRSVHYFFKEVAGKPLTRPAWFFDVRQQGEAVPDVGTHLVDLVQWECFPDQTLDYHKDIKVLAARRWATKLTPEQFKRATGMDSYPGYLKKDVAKDGVLNVFANGEVTWRLRGVHAKIAALWGFEPAPGAKDSHYCLMRGSKADLVIKQGPEQNYAVTLYAVNKDGNDAGFETALKAALAKISATWPGVDLKKAVAAHEWEILVPEKYKVGHEAHFAQVTERFLKYLAAGKLPDWEVPNMLAKYYTTLQAYELSHKSK